MDIITKPQAILSGLIHYFTGKPCKHSHVVPRYVSSGSCVECVRVLAQAKPEQVKKASREWNTRNKERMSDYRKEFYNNSENKQNFLNKCTEYRNSHKSKYAAHNRNRQAQRLNATPLWLTKEELKQIECLYEQSRILTEQTGVKYVVDHHYPLQGKTVSGLHCLANLIVIPAAENSEKKNKHPEDFYMVK